MKSKVSHCEDENLPTGIAGLQDSASLLGSRTLRRGLLIRKGTVFPISISLKFNIFL